MSHTDVLVFFPTALDRMARPCDLSSADDWFVAMELGFEFLESLARAGLLKVALVRYLGAAILGVDDGVVWRRYDEANFSVADPNDPIRVGDHFFFVPEERDDSLRPEFTGPDLPIHPKDATTEILSSTGQSRPAWHTSAIVNLAVRDLNLCQFAKTDPFESQPDSNLVRAHIVPFRRGDAIFLELEKARFRRSHRSDLDPLGRIGSVNDVRNVVSLSDSIHRAWDASEIGLLPLPNNAFDAHGSPLAYSQLPSSLPAPAAPPTDPPSSFRAPSAMFASVCSASRAVPLLSFLQFKRSSLAHLVGERARGPLPGRESQWPPEWVFTYRIGAQVCARVGTPALLEALSSAWAPYRHLDKRQGSARTSTTGSGGSGPRALRGTKRVHSWMVEEGEDDVVDQGEGESADGPLGWRRRPSAMDDAEDWLLRVTQWQAQVSISGSLDESEADVAPRPGASFNVESSPTSVHDS